MLLEKIIKQERHMRGAWTNTLALTGIGKLDLLDLMRFLLLFLPILKGAVHLHITRSA